MRGKNTKTVYPLKAADLGNDTRVFCKSSILKKEIRDDQERDKE